MLHSPDGTILLGGDFNLVMDNDLDRSGHRYWQTGALTAAGRHWLVECGLEDVWRRAHPTLRDYSFYPAATKTYARLDFFLASQELLSRVMETTIEPRALTDHVPITVVVTLHQRQVGASGWRFRDSLLQTGATVESIRRAITDYLSFNDDGNTCMGTLWEALKAVVRGEVMSLSARDNKARREIREELEQRVAALERSHQSTGAPRIWRELEKVRQQLKRQDWDREEYAIARLKHKYYIRSNRCGKLLAHRLRAQHAASTIKLVRSPSGVEARTSDQIVEAFAEFYRGLYVADERSNVAPDIFLEGIAITPLGEREASSLDQLVRAEEVISAISRLQVGKSPGPDGFTALFYKTLCVELVPLLVRLFNSF
ncbi:hypothetical protein NDU88_006439 [Pleurodeles waltl]|uniref:Endonuclease/exonuclease/phosphatase domain-containing protein n=1 Tax=Pleurodeles waltl TaxID=8319 RepID=A0AAV7TYJ0_PLEWA|nr:hypothetical protein NDU88_006439 [Pleurodeles waltl]